MGLVISKGLTLKSYNTPAAIAGVAPTLDYRFALDRREIEAISLTDKLTYTGATNGTFVNRAGLIERATTDQPRFDHGTLSRQSLGLLVEEQRTNSISNNTMVGAVAGTPGTLPTNWTAPSAPNGLSREIIATGVEDGIAYIDIKYSGTTTGAGVANVVPLDGVAASSGQAWTSSLYVALAAGTTNNVTVTHRIRSAVSGGGFLAGTDQVLSPTAGSLKGKRTAVTLSSAAATIASLGQYIVFSHASGAAIDITLRIGLPQLEQGAFATSVIPTTTTALTRTVDSAVIDGTGVITGTYTLVEKPAGCAAVNGTNIDLVSGFTAERVMVFPAALSAPQITAIRGAM
jgi:hypothetical protein